MTPKQNLKETIESLEKTNVIIQNDLERFRDQLKTLDNPCNDVDRINACMAVGAIAILEKMSWRIDDALKRAKFDPTDVRIPDYY